ncbi:hypothetical protein ACPEEZ_15030 [Frigoribacterium sp. 2-23]|uniref:hypothetical protein n=1 Tax=Frigoribacterium sp. 2-23 TaxID=3415006 RepID=UPI003C7036EE
MSAPLVSRAERIAKRITIGVVAAIVATVIAIGIPNKVPYRLDDLPEKNRAAWTMPLDVYLAPGYTRESYAQALLVQPCLAQAGYTGYTVPWRDIDAASLALDRVPIRAFDLSVAQKRGYHIANSDDPGQASWDDYTNRYYSEIPDRVREKCEAATGLDFESQTYDGFRANDLVNRLSNAAFLDARTDDKVQATVPAWRQCMSIAGYTDAGESPADMPTPDMAYDYSTTDPTTPVSKSEKEVAMTDATCRDTSGYLDALYEAEWDRQLTLPRDLAGILLKVDTRRLAEHKAKIDEILSTMTPPRPS